VADLADCTQVLTPLVKTPSVINTRASHRPPLGPNTSYAPAARQYWLKSLLLLLHVSSNRSSGLLQVAINRRTQSNKCFRYRVNIPGRGTGPLWCLYLYGSR
jgi:hypothetical protein